MSLLPYKIGLAFQEAFLHTATASGHQTESIHKKLTVKANSKCWENETQLMISLSYLSYPRFCSNISKSFHICPRFPRYTIAGTTPNN